LDSVFFTSSHIDAGHCTLFIMGAQVWQQGVISSSILDLLVVLLVAA
jgi:hypothetical protein